MSQARTSETAPEGCLRHIPHSGCGPKLAAAIVKATEIKPELRMGDLSEADVQKLENEDA